MNSQGRVLVFLQNAWSPVYAGKIWPRESWLKALSASRSGTRLQILVGGLEVEYHNTTPSVAAVSSGKLPVDHEHIAAALGSGPSVVIACGAQAAKAVGRAWAGPMLTVPHPAHRLLTNALYERGHELLSEGLTARVALRQGRGEIREEEVLNG